MSRKLSNAGYLAQVIRVAESEFLFSTLQMTSNIQNSYGTQSFEWQFDVISMVENRTDPA